MNIPIIRTSERRAIKRCPAAWWWGWREGLRQKGVAAPPLWFGIGIHIALAAWYTGPGLKRGPHPAETWNNYCDSEIVYIKTIDLADETYQWYVDARLLGTTLLNAYVERYGIDERKLYISSEQTFSLDIPWSDRQALYDFVEGQVMARYAGTFDGVWRHADSGWLVLDEHKTAKAIFTKHLALDDQGGSYWTMATRVLRAQGLIKPHELLRGIEYNFIRKSMPDTRPVDSEGYACNKPLKADYLAALEHYYSVTTGLAHAAVAGELAKVGKLTLAGLEQLANANGLKVLGERSKNQPSPLFERHMVHRTSKERNIQLRRIQDEAVVMQAYRDGSLPIIKNPTRDCSWDCSFYNMCELQENGGNWEEFKALQYRVEDPYADQRKSTDE